MYLLGMSVDIDQFIYGKRLVQLRLKYKIRHDNSIHDEIIIIYTNKKNIIFYFVFIFNLINTMQR